MENVDKKQSTIILVRWVGTFLALALIVYLLYQRWPDVQEAVREISIQKFFLAFGVLMFSRFMVIGRWYTLLRSAGMPISFREGLRLTFAGLFSSNFLPSTVGGDMVRLAGGIQKGFDGSVIAASLMMDRMVGVAGMFFILPVGVKLMWESGAFRFGGLPLVLFGIFAVGDKFSFQKIAAWIKRVTKKIIDAFKIWARKPLALFTALLFTFFHMLGLFGCMFVVLQDIESPLSFWVIGGLWSFVYLVTLLPISINGLGLQEVSIAYVFTNFGGISTHAGLILALSIRTLMMLASLPGAVFLPSIMTRAKRGT